MNLTPQFLSEEWLNIFCRAWNLRKGYHKYFEGLGHVLFESQSGRKKIKGQLYWDDLGVVSISNGAKDSFDLKFSAPLELWDSLIYDGAKPLRAVMEKKMQYKGKMKIAVHISDHFEYLSEVTKAINPSVD